jgi:large subunit ribosomal protein L6
MSRIGKKVIVLPAKVEISQNKNDVKVKGPKGELSATFDPDMKVVVDGTNVTVERPTDAAEHRALHGLTRALLANMVTGVSTGFRRTLQIEGVGYRSEIQGKNLVLKVGYSHDVVVEPPAGITFVVPQENRGTVIHIDGIDKQLVGQVAANVRGWRPPEPYLGKGIRYSDEVVRRKAGKAGKK